MDLSCFNEIYDQYYLLVMKVAYNVLNDYHYAQDICQEVFITLYKNLDGVDEGIIKPWLLVATKNRAIDLQRKKFYGLEVCEKSSDMKKHRDVRPEDGILKMEFGSQLFRSLKEKDGVWFEIVMRVSIEQEDPEQVARDMNLSLSNLRTKLHRARTWIRETFGEDYYDLM